ncbi:hypothetical protein [Acinetobacter pittii]|uniref:Uncharacterized protein n=1 Tax=Acinetobacter pittii TaxID=48296 RepID=A0AB37TE22_ACIPI|nr:hypothetical protein [Acinetobacter pittii]RSO57959.1 hypothetical protein EA752_13980 [Acinetobacter pittii]
MFETLKNLFITIFITSNNLTISKIKDNLPIIFIIPTTIGGIWQLFELSAFGISYIRFFSVPQLLPDGLLIISMFTVISIYLFYVTQVYESLKFKYYINKSFSKLTSILILNIIIAIGLIIFTLKTFKDFKTFTSFVLYIAILYFILRCILFIVQLIITISYKLKEKDVSQLDEFIENVQKQDFHKPYVLMASLLYLASIIIITFFLIKPLRDFAYYPTNLENLTKLENELIKNFKLCEPPKLKYFNKDYLFYKFEIDNKERVYVIESKNLFLSPLEPIIKEKKESED